MRVTAFIRDKAAKNNVTDKATIYFRVRDERTHTDIKAASELTINPNHWSSERQGYKGRVSLVPDEVRLRLNKQVLEITEIISREFYIGASNEWLKNLIFAYHHPNAFKLCNGELVETGISIWIDKYVEAKKFNTHQASNFKGLRDKVNRFEAYVQQVKKRKKYRFAVGTAAASDLAAFQNYMEHEHEYAELYPFLFKDVPNRSMLKIKSPRGSNTITNLLTMLRSVIRWAIQNGVPGENPFDKFTMPGNLYGTPFYLTIEERDKVFNHDFSDDPVLAEYRDMFIFQCMVGCRHGDLVTFTTDNIIDGVLEYIPTKTRNKIGQTVRVPLGAKAMSIINRFDRLPGSLLFPLRFNFKYNNAIREILTRAGITRVVTVIDTKTRTETKRPINEIASSHMARRTFIGNLYRQVKDPNLVASMSGHAAGSKAFARYRTIDDDIKKELIGLID